MADARVDIKFLVDASSLRQAEAEFKRSQQFLTSYQIAENEKRLRHTQSASSKQRADISSLADAHKKAQQAITRATEQSNRTQEQLSKKNTKALIADYFDLQQKKKNINLAIEREYDRHTKAVLQADRKYLDQQLREYKTAAMKRGEVLTQGAGAKVGILGTGRNLIGAGLFKAGAVAAIATAGMSALTSLTAHAKEADDAIDAVDIALAKVGMTDAATREQMMKDGAQIANDFAKRTSEVNRLQAVVAGYGGQVGETNKRIVELALANEQALGVPAENLAKMFAKASDPENEAQLSRLGLVFKKGATEAERWTAINERFGQSIQKAKDSTKDGVGNMARVMNTLNDTFAKVALTLVDSLAPALQSLMPILESILPFIGGLLKSIADAIKWTIGAVRDAKNFLGGEQQKARVSVARRAGAVLSKISAEVMEEVTPDMPILAIQQKIRKAAGNYITGKDAQKFIDANANVIADMALAIRKEADKKFGEKAQASGIQTDTVLGMFAHETTPGAKPPSGGGKGETLEQRQKRLYEEFKSNLDRQKREGLISEIAYYDQLIEAAKKYFQKKEQLSAESDKRIAERQQEPLIAPRRTRSDDGLPDIPVASFLEKEDLVAPNRDRNKNRSLSDIVGAEEGQTEKTFNGIRDAVSPATDAVSAFVGELLAGRNAARALGDTFVASLTSMAAALAGKLALFGIFSLLTGGTGAVFNFAKTALGFSGGGVVPQYLAAGGHAGDSNTIRMGGFISKAYRKGSDTVPAMLTPGEGILSKEEMRLLGRDGFKKLRQTIRMGGFISRTGHIADGDSAKETIRSGGFISRSGMDSSAYTADMARQRVYNMEASTQNNAALLSEIQALRQAVSQKQTIIMDSYGAYLGQLKAQHDNSIGVF